MSEAAAATVASPARGRGRAAVWGALTLGLAALLVALVWAGDARLEPATWALVASAGALVYVIVAMWGMARAVARPSMEVVLASAPTGAAVDRRALREERTRLLRSIKELDFDHALGKLGDGDYRQVREAYLVRAVEVTRALEQSPGLHPEVAAWLAAPATDGVPASTAEPGAESASAAPVESRACERCGTANDPDARFCKACGAALAPAADAGAPAGADVGAPKVATAAEVAP